MSRSGKLTGRAGAALAGRPGQRSILSGSPIAGTPTGRASTARATRASEVVLGCCLVAGTIQSWVLATWACCLLGCMMCYYITLWSCLENRVLTTGTLGVAPAAASWGLDDSHDRCRFCEIGNDVVCIFLVDESSISNWGGWEVWEWRGTNNMWWSPWRPFCRRL